MSNFCQISRRKTFRTHHNPILHQKKSSSRCKEKKTLELPNLRSTFRSDLLQYFTLSLHGILQLIPTTKKRAELSDSEVKSQMHGPFWNEIRFRLLRLSKSDSHWRLNCTSFRSSSAQVHHSRISEEFQRKGKEYLPRFPRRLLKILNFGARAYSTLQIVVYDIIRLDNSSGLYIL